jgi:hypothetical protein
LIFGFSSLHFNHGFSFAEPQAVESAWERAIPLRAFDDNLKAAEAIRDDLGLMGWPLPWRMNRDPQGNLHFDMECPGKSYTIHVFTAENRVRVEERRKGFWPVVNSLHAIMDLPGSSFVRWWGYYTEFCVWAVVFSAVSGVYLWAQSRRERQAGVWVLGLAVGGSFLFMAYVILWG